MKKFLSNATLMDVTSNHFSPSSPLFKELPVLKLELEFAEKLVLGDQIWFQLSSGIKEYPYIKNLTEDNFQKWCDAWYEVIGRSFEGSTLVIEVCVTHCEEVKHLRTARN